ncbi:MAG: guanylate kinase [Deltaproteobacteria bacterium]|nr:guanylate kinase [Deltaproteobacteria bacterium]
MLNKKRKGRLFIISAPSGAGKTTLCHAVLAKLSQIVPSISYTTRAPREGEVTGKDYHFVSPQKFKAMIEEHAFAEWAIVHGHYYGTNKNLIEKSMQEGNDVLLSIDIQGADQLRKLYSDAVSVFINPPSLKELKNRLIDRKSDSQMTIQKRLEVAKKEIAAAPSYQFQVVNDDFEQALEELISIIKSQRHPS